MQDTTIRTLTPEKNPVKNSRQEELHKKIDDLVLESSVDLFSFDIFDTLITRTTIEPIGIFALMQKELGEGSQYSNIPSYVRDNFYFLRSGAERFLNITKNLTKRECYMSASEVQQEFSLPEIYNVIKQQNNLTDEAVQTLINLEMKTEYDNILPIEENIEVIKYLLSGGRRVVLISDMYLPENFIRSLLVKFDDVFKEIPIYVSSEYNKRKYTKELYAAVKEAESMDYQRWLHIGDNSYADDKMPEELEIKTHLFERVKMTKIEERAFNNNYDKASVQLALGAARNLRQLYPDSEKADFATIAGIMIFPYIKWILDRCTAQGIKRLHFISRDGYVMQKIADIIIKQENLDIETHYIYGSREAWRMPSVEKAEDLWFAFTQYKNIPFLDTIAKILQVDTESLIKFLPKYYHNPKKKLTENDYININYYLSTNPEFIEMIKENNKEKKQLLKEYLAQAVDFSDDNFAFVDLSGSTVTQDCLGKFILKNFQRKLKCFYYSNSRRIDNKYVTKFMFFPSNSFYSFTMFIEMAFRAPHGQVVGYRKEEGKVLPVFDEKEGAYFEKNYDEYTNLVEEFIENYCFARKINNIKDNSINMFTDYFRYIKTRPDSTVSSYFGDIPFTIMGNDTSGDKGGCRRLSLFDVINYRFFGKTVTVSEQYKLSLSRSFCVIKAFDKFFLKHPKIRFKTLKNAKYIVMILKHKFK